MALSELSTLPRTEQTSDFHCVAGWSATELRWEGVRFTTFYQHRVGDRFGITGSRWSIEGAEAT